MTKLACLLPISSQYDSVHYFVRSLARAFERKGLDVNVFDPNEGQVGRSIRSYGADAMVGFNNFYLDPEDVMLCDRLQIPYFAFLVDGPHHFIPFYPSRFLRVSCVDERDARFFREELHFDRAYFLPHAIDPSLCELERVDPIYPVTFLGTCIDYQGIQRRWRQQLPDEDVDILERTIERCREERHLCYFDALVQELQDHGYEEELEDINSLFIATLWNLVDLYMRGRDRVELIQALSDFPVHIFGQSFAGVSWEKGLDPLPKHVTLHPPLPFEQALEVMRRSQLLLNPFPSFRAGMHERILYGMACGAVVVADENPFLKGQFQDERELLLYQPGKWEKLVQKIDKVLSDNILRLDISESSRQSVQQSHNWECRVNAILKALDIRV